MLTRFTMTFTFSRSARWILGALCAWSTFSVAQTPTVDADIEAVSRLVQTHLGLYVTRPERRDQGERVYLRQRQLEAWLHKPLSPKTAEAAVCQGARWLLTGRLRKSRGAGALFAARPDIGQVTLVFYGVQTRVDPDRNGRYQQRRTVEPHARFTVSRERAQQLSPEALAAQLSAADCGKTARVVLDELWVKKTR